MDLIKTASFSAVSSFSFDADTFTSTYDNYKLIMTWTQSTGNDELGFRMRLAGTDATGTDYISQFIQGNNTTVTAERNTETSGRLSYSGAYSKNGLAAEIFGPKLAASTLYRSINAAPTSSVWFLRDFNGIHTPATAYDSMTIIPRTGTITGTYSIYGYKK